MHDLSGAWSLSDESGEHSAPMTLPGDGIDALFKAVSFHYCNYFISFCNSSAEWDHHFYISQPHFISHFPDGFAFKSKAISI